MPTPDILASTIMDLSAALLNDAAKSDYTYAAQLPYLRIALKELKEFLALNDFAVTVEKSVVITVPQGVSSVGFNTVPALPADLIEIQRVWESDQSNDTGWIPIGKSSVVSNHLSGVSVGQLGVWAWNDNAINFPVATGIVYLKIDYIKDLFTAYVDENTNIGVINGDLFLIYRNAALCANFIGENKERSDELNGFAVLSRDNIIGIENKGKQFISTRRRPFRSGYKSGGY